MTHFTKGLKCGALGERKGTCNQSIAGHAQNIPSASNDLAHPLLGSPTAQLHGPSPPSSSSSTIVCPVLTHIILPCSLPLYILLPLLLSMPIGPISCS